MTIRFRIIVGFLLIVAAGFFWLTRWLVDDLRPHYLKSMEESLVDQSAVLASVVSASMDSSGIPYDDLRAAFGQAERRRFTARIYDFVKTQSNVRVYITDTTGLVVFDSDDARDEGKDYSRWNDVYLTLRGKYGARATRLDENDPATSVLYVAAPLVRDERIVGALAVAKPADSVNRFVERAEKNIIGGALLASLVVFVLGVLLSLWVTLPVRRLTAYARAVRDNRPVALPRLGSGEMAMMGSAMDEMREALEGKQYVEQYVQSLTHEIKSPVSAIRGAAELLDEEMPSEERAKFTENIRNETERIQGIVDRMLQLASVESRRGLKDVEEADLAGVIAETAESMSAQFESHGVALDVHAPDAMPVRCERFLLRQALGNLLQNALDFSSPGGAVSVELTRTGDSVLVAINDSGPGIPDYALDKVYERFYSLPRPETSRKSSGLGLSFARQVAQLHGGTVQIENRSEGGARATMSVRTSKRVDV